MRSQERCADGRAACLTTTMYESRFGITGPPFQLSPDPSFYFDSRGHHRVLEQLRRGFAEETGFIVVSGEIGAGKTTLVRALLGELDPAEVAVAHVVSTQLDADELIAAALIGFGIPVEASESQQLVSRLLAFVLKLDKKAKRASLIIDEAQNLRDGALERLVSIVARRGPRPLPFQVCLVGQPELRTMVEGAGPAGLRALVAVSCHLGPIQAEETGAYIEHRLRKVGWSGSPRFEAGSFEEIHRWTGGIPRRINLLCNRLMLSRFLASETTIAVETVQQTARDLREEMGEPGGEPSPSCGAAALQPQAPRQEAPGAPKLTAPLVPPMDREPLLCIVASHSDHIKAAALMRAMAAHPGLPAAKLVRVHDNDALELSRSLYTGLDIGRHLMNLGIGEVRPGEPPAELTKVFEFVVDHVLPKAIIVFDGSEASHACSTVAHGKGVPVVVIGAGLRVDDGSADAADPRRATDRLADLLYTTDAHASATLVEEGVPPEHVHCVGNLIVDSVQLGLRALAGSTLRSVGVHVSDSVLADRNGYALVVLSRTPDVGKRESLIELLNCLQDICRDVPLVWPMPSRVERQLKKHRLTHMLANERIVCLPVQPYPEYLALLRHATCLLTDSWNAQEEATALGTPCLTLGPYPERSITVSAGSNVAVGLNRTLLTRTVWECIYNGGKRGSRPELWDGKTGSRIASYLSAWLPASTR